MTGAPNEGMNPRELTNRVPAPERYDPEIALVGCGSITQHHLEAYRDAGYDVVAFCDVEEERARERRDEFYPDASVHTDVEAVLEDDSIDVVDIATPPGPREELVERALRASKHVLSQKPFVRDLDVGRSLVELADENDVRLAVNQNGRWAPHWNYVLRAIDRGFVDPFGAYFSVFTDHDWIVGTHFDAMDHWLIYDYAIHWFDVIHRIFADREPRRVYASESHAPNQEATEPLLSLVGIEYDDAHASIRLNGGEQHSDMDRTRVIGTEGTIECEGPSLNDQSVTLHLNDETVRPSLQGRWFTDGFRGAMGELLCAIEEDREPDNSGHDNLKSLELCYAAVASAEDGEPKVPGEVDRLPS